MKGICPECGEVVKAKRLIFGNSVTQKTDTPFYLCDTHEAKKGHRENQVVSVPSGKIVETHCWGSMRPPKELIEEH